MRALLAGLAIGALAGAALAQTSTRPAAPGIEDNRREVRQMVDLLDITKHAETLLGTMRVEIIRATVRASDLPEDKAAEIVDQILMPNFTARSGELVAEMMEPYALNFTVSDLKALRTFFGSSLGQKWLRGQKLSRSQGETAGLAWGQRVFQDSVDRHVDELRARGLKF